MKPGDWLWDILAKARATCIVKSMGLKPLDGRERWKNQW
jgi:hypothetical protein